MIPNSELHLAKQKRAELRSVLDPQTKKRVGELICDYKRILGLITEPQKLSSNASSDSRQRKSRNSC